MKIDREVMPQSEYITRAEAANLLGMSSGWLKKTEKAGRGPARVRLGKCIRYLPESVREFARSLAVEV